MLKMATNLALDDQLIREAQTMGKHKTKKEAVTAALKQYIAQKRQLGALKLMGKIDFDRDFDYKKARKR
jgi:Arc/MetJ family transcription regulator